MTQPLVSGARRTLQDDLLEDLRQRPGHPAAPAATSLPPAAVTDVPTVHSPLPAPALELRITPRLWASGWTRRTGEDGLTVSLGPVCLSIGRVGA